MHSHALAQMVGLDWGTSSLRAYLLGPGGLLIDQRVRPWGIRALPEGGYAAALDDITAGWPGCPLLASGMVGSRRGWQESPYRDIPAVESDLVAGISSIRDPGARGLRIIPGLRDPANGEVMRGEETQVYGSLALEPSLAKCCRLVLPGTHSKWVHVTDGAITGFHTLMTGEIFNVLQHHTILGEGMPSTTPDPAPDDQHDAFELGVAEVRDAGPCGVFGRLFSARTRWLSGQLKTRNVPAYLSGLLIGEEWRIALASGWLEPDIPIRLVGETMLCSRYQHAGRLFGVATPVVIEHATSQGLWRLGEKALEPVEVPTQPDGGHA